MTTKDNKLIYEFRGVTSNQIIDIDPVTLDFDDGNNLSTVVGSFFMEIIAVSINPAFSSGIYKIRYYFSYNLSNSSNDLVAGGGTPIILGGNVANISFPVFSVNMMKMTIALSEPTSTDIRIFVDVKGYND